MAAAGSPGLRGSAYQCNLVLHDVQVQPHAAAMQLRRLMLYKLWTVPMRGDSLVI